MVHFPEFARTRLCIYRAVIRFYRIGFPHSEIPGSKPACGSPRLIAACHVLHRLLLPRHPPCALSSLTTKFTQHTRITPVEPCKLIKSCFAVFVTSHDAWYCVSRRGTQQRHSYSLILGLYRFSQCYSVVKHRLAGLLRRPASAGLGQQSCPEFGVNATYL